MKRILVLAAALLLSGCVLQSKAPNFSEAEGRPLLGKSGGTYQSFEFADGKWTTDGTDAKMLAVGQHYELTEKGVVTKILFVPIDGPWWVAQFNEQGKAYAYVLLDAEAGEIYVHPLMCTDLKKVVAAKAIVKFVKDDCFLKAHTPPQKLMSLIAKGGEHKLKLVLKK